MVICTAPIKTSAPEPASSRTYANEKKIKVTKQRHRRGQVDLSKPGKAACVKATRRRRALHPLKLLAGWCNVAASIYPGASANRHTIELAAKQSIATAVSKIACEEACFMLNLSNRRNQVADRALNRLCRDVGKACGVISDA